MIQAGIDRGRVVLVRGTFAVLVGGEDVPDFLAVQGAAIKADFVELSCERIARALSKAKVEVVTRLRDETAEITLDCDNAIDINPSYPGWLVISQRVVTPADTRTFTAYGDLMTSSVRVE